MKKVLIGLLLGLSVGVVAGKMLTHVEVAEENEKKVEESVVITLQRRKILSDNDGYCDICGEKLVEGEKYICDYCEEWNIGYAKGVEDTLKKYGLSEE